VYPPSNHDALQVAIILTGVFHTHLNMATGTDKVFAPYKGNVYDKSQNELINVEQYSWQKHCAGLFHTPIAI
tara:strand:+ start:237 stop:452 length:216 start_codon:yes stop_codon:yes gene_type:complete